MKRTAKIMPQAVKHAFEKPATVNYPANREDVFTNVRGKLIFEADKCIGCKMCARDCPTKAIEIEKVGDKRFKAVVRMDLCIYCGQCVISCHKDALHNTEEFELAKLNKDDMKMDI